MMGKSNPKSPGSSDKGNGQGASKKSLAFTISQDPVLAEPTEETAHKYEAAPLQDLPRPTHQSPEFEDLGPLPSTYDEDTLFLTARDPRWLFSYWDFDWSRYPAAEHRHGVAQFFLKVKRMAGEEETTVEIKPEARNWYVAVNQPDTSYFAELGYFGRQAEWIPIVRSGLAHTPPDAVHSEAMAEFATVPSHLAFERLRDAVHEHMLEGESLLQAIARVTGEGKEIEFVPGRPPSWTEEQRTLLALLLGDSVIERVGLGSGEIEHLLRKQFGQHAQLDSFAFGAWGPETSSLFSAIGASWSAQPFSVHAERGFYMHVNAEIIFYGGTHPDATVWIAGQQIQLSPDGKFRYQFTLPNGDFLIPIVAESPDKVEQRSATFSFRRTTETAGDVKSTAQPPELSPLIGKQ